MRCSMPRRARIAPGEIIYHALNRANGRSQLFDKPEDYAANYGCSDAPFSNPNAGLLFDAQSLAHGPVAEEKRRDDRVSSLAHAHSQPAPTRPPPHHRLRAYLSRAVQKFSRRAGSSRAQCDPLCGTQRLASPARFAGAKLALVQSMAKSSWGSRIAAERLALR